MNISFIGNSFSVVRRAQSGGQDHRSGAAEGGTDEDGEVRKVLARASAGAKAKGEQLTEDELKQLQQLQARDREVRVHEAAHMAAAGGLATGGASFSYQKGPDGGNYAVGGEVNIDTSAVANDPAATLRKAETIRRAALAPADPSSQDRQVASAAAQMQSQALSDLSEQRRKQQAESAQAYIKNLSTPAEDAPAFRVHLTA